MNTIDLCSLYQSLCKFFAKDNNRSSRLQVPGLLADAFCQVASKLLLSGFALVTGTCICIPCTL